MHEPALARRFLEVRRFSERLCEPLEIEDYVVQSMPDASPLKWHLAHTTWFFETFVLACAERAFRPHDARWGSLHNSYYEALGARHPRARRGLLTRPTVREVRAYRAAVDARVAMVLGNDDAVSTRVLELLELGLHHEQQHQELMLTDLQHALFENPLRPAVFAPPHVAPRALHPPKTNSWIEHEGALRTIGHGDSGFAFDNEGPEHTVYLEPFAVASELVTAGEYTAFIEDDGYARPELWLSDGWAAAQAGQWRAPLYWERRDETWIRHSLHGELAVDPAAPVCHISFYEADAYARWKNARLPTEAEWEVAAARTSGDGQFVDSGSFVPLAREGSTPSLMGSVWTWTASAYAPYPGFLPAAGAVGEYNGKFMVNQIVLRGGSCCSSRSHIRATYRNFFPPPARWQVSGIRLARRLGSSG